MKVRPLILGLISLVTVSSCNFHTDSICDSRAKISLDSFVGNFNVKSLVDEEGESFGGPASLSQGDQPLTYTLKITDEDGSSETLFKNAQVCKVNSKMYAESKSLYNTEFYTLLEVGQTAEGKFKFAIPLYNTDKLDADGVKYEDVSGDFLEGFSVEIDNSNISAEKLVDYLQTASILIQE